MIVSKLHQKLDEEFSLNIEILNVPYCRQDTRLPSKKDDLRLRFSVLLSAMTKLFFRAKAIDSQMVFINIEHIVQQSIKERDIKGQQGIRFLLALAQQEGRTSGPGQCAERWQSRLKEIDEIVETELSECSLCFALTFG